MLWESNAILFYFAAKYPGKGLWPSATAEGGSMMPKKLSAALPFKRLCNDSSPERKEESR